MDGKATFTAVESRKTTPEPSTMANKTHLPRALEKLRTWAESGSFSCLCTLLLCQSTLTSIPGPCLAPRLTRWERRSPEQPGGR